MRACVHECVCACVRACVCVREGGGGELTTDEETAVVVERRWGVIWLMKKEYNIFKIVILTYNSSGRCVPFTSFLLKEFCNTMRNEERKYY